MNRRELSASTPRISYVPEDVPSIKAAPMRMVERLLGANRIQQIYDELKSKPFSADDFFPRAIELAHIKVCRDPESEARIPRTGPLLFIANHPFGIIDGLVLCDLAVRTRGDFRILINAMLCRDPDLAAHFLPVDFDDSPEAMSRNLASRRAAIRTLAGDGTVLVFPSGGVATATRRLGFGQVEEFPWTTFVSKLVSTAQATVVPVYFAGHNSRLFHFASWLGEAPRMTTLIHEARNKIGREVNLSIGEPIPYERLAQLPNRRAVTEHLFESVMALGDGQSTA